MNDTRGEHWQFHATGLAPGRPYTLSIEGADGRSLCEPWTLSTFPPADARPERFRALFFTCAGGPGGAYDGVGERSGFLPTAIRKLTSDPADAYGSLDRGRLTPGAWADMILFDPDTVTITNMERHFDLPAGGERLLRRAPGLHGTWVNGVRVFDGEDYLSVPAPGQVLREFAPGLPTLGMPRDTAAAE